MGRNFALLLGAQIFLSFGGLSIPPLLPFLQGALQLTYAEVGSIMTFHYLGAILMSPPAGWITDRLGVKKAIVFSLFFTGTMVALLSLIGSYLAAILITLMVGLGYGMSNPPTTKGIMMLFKGKNLGLAMSAKQTGVPIAGGIAAGLLPPLALLFSWQFSFIVAGVLIGVAGLLSQILMRQDLEHFRPSPVRRRGPSPSDWKKIYRNKNIILLSIAGAFCALVQTFVFTYTILYLKDAQKFTLIEAAFCLTLMNIGGIIGRVVWGVMSDRLFKGSRKIVLLLLVAIIFLISLTLGLNIYLPRFTLILMLFVLGASAIGWNGVYHAFIGEIAGKEMSGRATGLVMTVVFLGSVIGPIICGKIIDLSGSYHLAWMFLAAAMASAFVVYGMIREEGGG